MFVAADGTAPTDEAKRMTLVQMFSMETAAYVSMHESLPELQSFTTLKRIVFKYIRTLRNLKRTAPRAAHLLDEAPEPEVEDQEPDEEELMARLLASDDVDEQMEILAGMRQGGFRPPARGEGGQRKFAPRAGPPRTGPAARSGAPPPRDRKDIICINCNRKATLHQNAGSQR